MNIDNLYRGTLKINCIDKITISDFVSSDLSINKDGVEVLLYKLINNDYLDLKTKKIYHKEDITNLIELNKIISLGHNVSRKRIIKLYEQDLENEIDLDNLFIGDLAFIYKVDKELIENELIEKPETSIVEYNKLLLKKGLEYLDLESYNCYSEEYKLGKITVINIKPFIEMVNIEEKTIKKVKALNHFRKMF